MFVIADRIQRSHNSILFSVPWKDCHFMFGIECPANLRLRTARFLHLTVTVGLTNGTFQNLVDLFLSKFVGIRSSLTSVFFLEEARLQVFRYMFVHSLFGILLHVRVDSCINFQSVGIDVIVCSILFLVLCTPSVQRIVFPRQRILIILLLLPASVVWALRFLCSHNSTQILAEISCQSVFMVNRLEFQCQRQCLQWIPLGFGNIIGLVHLVEHRVTASARALVVPARIIQRRILAHTYQRSSFLYCKILRVFRKISLGGSLDTYCIVQKVELVEVHSQDFFLGVITFQFYGNHPFYRLLQQTFHYIICSRRIKLLSQLLCNGTATSCMFLHKDTTFDNGTHKRTDVYAGMFAETYILCCNKCMYQIRRQIIVAYIYTIFLTVRPGTQQLTVVGYNLGCKFQIRVFQFLHRRHITNPPFCDSCKDYSYR